MPFIVVFFILGSSVGTVPACAAGELDVVMDNDAVMNDMEFCVASDFTFFVKDRAMECDVVSLPFAGFTAGVNEWFGAAVEGAALTVGVSDVLVAVQHLNFILAHKENTAVSAALTSALGDGWGGEFNVQSA